ncbi:MAG: CRTAC1 family protein [Bryobacterales bacterium]|nr:CRTAC1 family protein [Bryobacterales bacterium]
MPFAFLLAAAAALPQFVDMTAQSGIGFKHEASHTPEKYLLESMSAGVAMIDYDGDGKLDLFFVNGASLPATDKLNPRYWNRLYRNNGNLTFTDVTERAGVRGHSYGMGVATGDYDNDGRTDLYVTNHGRNILYRNRGDGTFSDVTDKAGVAASGWSTGAMFVDYDHDGALDLFVSRYVDWNFSRNPYCGDRKPGFRSYCHPDQFKPVSHLLFHNNRDGTFTDVTVKSGIAKALGKGLGVAFQDYDRDGWPDVLVANDSFPQQLFHNKRDGTFEEVALALGLAYDEDGRTFAGMGADFADYDNDGWPDVFINALANQRYSLFRNLKESFEYVTGASGVGQITARHSGWGTRFLDYDNDGWLDLFVAQGHVMDNIELTQPGLRYLEPPLLMRNIKGKFEDVSIRSGEIFKTPLAARGAAFGDLDNDGFTDIVINCNDGRPVILRNHGNTNHWLTVNVEGQAAGARVKLTAESGSVIERVVSTAGSYLSASDPRVMFGLGQDRRIRSIEVTWTDGSTRKVENLEPGRIVNVAPR